MIYNVLFIGLSLLACMILGFSFRSDRRKYGISPIYEIAIFSTLILVETLWLIVRKLLPFSSWITLIPFVVIYVVLSYIIDSKRVKAIRAVRLSLMKGSVEDFLTNILKDSSQNPEDKP